MLFRTLFLHLQLYFLLRPHRHLTPRVGHVASVKPTAAIKFIYYDILVRHTRSDIKSIVFLRKFLSLLAKTRCCGLLHFLLVLRLPEAHHESDKNVSLSRSTADCCVVLENKALEGRTMKREIVKAYYAAVKKPGQNFAQAQLVHGAFRKRVNNLVLL